MERVRLSLDGLSVGDAFGQRFFIPGMYEFCSPTLSTPDGPWEYTDDTEMALGLVEVLDEHGRVESDELARTFALRYALDPGRGYGATAHKILQAIRKGVDWRDASANAFNGEGSMGNGSAMRVAPLGAYFADELDRVVAEARLSAEVTHAHAEGIAGAIATAVAAATAWHVSGQRAEGRILAAAWDRTPAGTTRDRIAFARELPPETPAEEVGRLVGDGSRVTCPDTVPFTLWVADHFAHDYPAALWATVSAGGDVDTTCAIVGGIVALSAEAKGIPPEWIAEREALK
jgi:ADP-ribosylglycohydrolase